MNNNGDVLSACYYLPNMKFDKPRLSQRSHLRSGGDIEENLFRDNLNI